MKMNTALAREEKKWERNLKGNSAGKTPRGQSFFRIFFHRKSSDYTFGIDTVGYHAWPEAAFAAESKLCS